MVAMALAAAVLSALVLGDLVAVRRVPSICGSVWQLPFSPAWRNALCSAQIRNRCCAADTSVSVPQLDLLNLLLLLFWTLESRRSEVFPLRFAQQQLIKTGK